MPAPPLANSFEGGTDTTVISAANSGGASGNAFSTIVGSPPFSATQARGAMSMGIVPVSTTSTYVRWDALGTITSSVYFRWYLYLTAIPATNVYNQMYVRTQANATCMTLTITTAGKIRMANAAGATVGSDGAVTLNTGSWCRVECRVLPSITAGEIEWRLYNTPDSSTPDEAPATTGSLVLGADVGEVAFGFVSGTAPSNGISIYYDDLAVSTAGWIGPSAAPALLLPPVPPIAMWP